VFSLLLDKVSYISFATSDFAAFVVGGAVFFQSEKKSF
jgi:hypothetical protein